MSSRLFHGGVPDLRVGDLIEPGHSRRAHDGCPWCEARARGDAHLGMDGPSQHAGRVYATEHRLYAKYHASLWGRGDLYRVEPVGDVQPSDEDSIPSVHTPALKVMAVVDRAILLTNSERRRLYREWGIADNAKAQSSRSTQGLK